MLSDEDPTTRSDRPPRSGEIRPGAAHSFGAVFGLFCDFFSKSQPIAALGLTSKTIPRFSGKSEGGLETYCRRCEYICVGSNAPDAAL